MGSAMVPLDRALLTSCKLSVVTSPLSVTIWRNPQCIIYIVPRLSCCSRLSSARSCAVD